MRSAASSSPPLSVWESFPPPHKSVHSTTPEDWLWLGNKLDQRKCRNLRNSWFWGNTRRWVEDCLKNTRRAKEVYTLGRLHWQQPRCQEQCSLKRSRGREAKWMCSACLMLFVLVWLRRGRRWLTVAEGAGGVQQTASRCGFRCPCSQPRYNEQADRLTPVVMELKR